MARRDWHLLGEVVAAVSAAHTARAVPRRIGEALAPRWDAFRVRFSPVGAAALEAVRHGRGWETRELSATEQSRMADTPAIERHETGEHLVLPTAGGEVAIWLGPEAPPLGRDVAYLETMARLVGVGLENQRLVRRVADLSRRAHAESRELRATIERLGEPAPLVARSAAMKATLERVALVAGYDTAVLIEGESGTGKELLSREIHRRSRRAAAPFLQVNCGAIPEALVESELFGHERGAFTGAERRHRGLFERADGGTLLLDEVGDLPLAAQVKLLRVLQEGRLRRVGGEDEIAVDVRVLAATNRGLAEMVRSGEFREDLFYRLAVFPIEVPALRRRGDDLAPLVAQLVAERAARLGVAPPPVTPAVLARLAASDWPGNVRQLANVLEAAIIAGGGERLELSERLPAAPAHSGGAPVIAFDEAARRAIAAALSSTGGKIYGPGGAAEALDLNPATLQSKMRKLGLRRADFVASPLSRRPPGRGTMP